MKWHITDDLESNLKSGQDKDSAMSGKLPSGPGSIPLCRRVSEGCTLNMFFNPVNRRLVIGSYKFTPEVAVTTTSSTSSSTTTSTV